MNIISKFILSTRIFKTAFMLENTPNSSQIHTYPSLYSNTYNHICYKKRETKGQRIDITRYVPKYLYMSAKVLYESIYKMCLCEEVKSEEWMEKRKKHRFIKCIKIKHFSGSCFRHICIKRTFIRFSFTTISHFPIHILIPYVPSF